MTSKRGDSSAAAIKSILEQQGMKNQLEALWHEPKIKLGEEAAGKSLQHFMFYNTKELDFDPFREGRESGQPFVSSTTGSYDPLTIDTVIGVSKLIPTTKEGILVDPVIGYYMAIVNGSVLYRIGKWSYAFKMPEPAEGKELEPWEHVRLVTVRSTAPLG